jgi:hypothetical protein
VQPRRRTTPGIGGHPRNPRIGATGRQRTAKYVRGRRWTVGARKLRIWGSGVRISPGAPPPSPTAARCYGDVRRRRGARNGPYCSPSAAPPADVRGHGRNLGAPLERLPAPAGADDRISMGPAREAPKALVEDPREILVATRGAPGHVREGVPLQPQAQALQVEGREPTTAPVRDVRPLVVQDRLKRPGPDPKIGEQLSKTGGSPSGRTSGLRSNRRTRGFAVRYFGPTHRG